MPVNQKFVQALPAQLYGSGSAIEDTSIILVNFSDPAGNVLSMADFGNTGYGTMEPNNGTQQESFTFTGLTVNGNGSVTLTGIKTVLFKSPYTQTSGLRLSHAGGTNVIISNTPAFYNQLASISDDETISGTWTFTAPNYPQIDNALILPTLSAQFATKAYVDSVSIAGAPKATNTVYGITRLSTPAVVPTAPIAVGDNDTRVPTQNENDALVGTSGAPSSSNKYVTDADTTGTGSVIRSSVTNSLSPLNNSISLTAFSKLTAGQALSIGNGTVAQLSSQAYIGANTVNLNHVNSSTSIWTAFVFTTPDIGVNSYITSGSLKMSQAAGSLAPSNVKISIRATSAGSPTGSDLDSVTLTSFVPSPTTGDSQIAFTLSGAASLTPNTQYAIIIRLDVYNSPGDWSFYGTHTSANSGSTWTPVTLNATANESLIYKQVITSGQVFPSTAVANDSGVIFVGFANANTNAGASVVITDGGVYSGLTSLTIGSNYYLSNTYGTISTSAGSTSRKVGIALSPTQLLITNIW